MPPDNLRQAQYNLKVAQAWVNGWDAGMWQGSAPHVGEELRRFRDKSLADVARFSDPVGHALEATRADGLAIYNALDQAWHQGKKMPPVEALRTLKAAWDGIQVHLAVVQEAHQGAMDWFVHLKDELKADLLKRQDAAGE